MEHLHSRIATLHDLWSSLGVLADVDTMNYKLRHVFHELDKVIQYERLQKQLLSADIEDTLTNIESACCILGIPTENILASSLCEDIASDALQLQQCFHPTFARQSALSALSSRLINEIQQRRSQVKTWLVEISQLTAELAETHTFKSFEEYEDELSWATVQSISCALRDLLQRQTLRRDEFEVTAQAIHFYWTVLGFSISHDDPIEVALSQIFHKLSCNINIHVKPSFHASAPEKFIYYSRDMPSPLLLSTAVIDAMKAKASLLEAMYDERHRQYTKYINSIRTIWDELNIAEDRRCVIRESLDVDYLNELQVEFEKVKSVVRAMTDEYIEKFRARLENLWDKCLLTPQERDEFISKLHEKADTMDQVRDIVDEHIKYLQKIQTESELVARLMQQRKDLIQKMIDFEKNASDPKRLFQASFQLLEEERWRNTCFPTLLQLDDNLIQAVQDFERVSGKCFMYGDRRYMDTLLEEIAERAANQTFFGFLTPEPSERTNRSSYGKNRSVTSTSVSSVQTKRRTLAKAKSYTAQSPPSSGSPSFSKSIQPPNRRLSAPKTLISPTVTPSRSTHAVKSRMSPVSMNPKPSASISTHRYSESKRPSTPTFVSSSQTLRNKRSSSSFTAFNRAASCSPTDMPRRPTGSKMPPTPPAEVGTGNGSTSKVSAAPTPNATGSATYTSFTTARTDGKRPVSMRASHIPIPIDSSMKSASLSSSENQSSESASSSPVNFRMSLECA
ncbi:microtubule associated protein-domain-containing protein [Radiomyces spectabilis]|uniref:microtubule associated protein-domain-containing protein n=1 Tax=Radiomyces spectabilis TaxID=64574 RepID=UPI00221FFE23|nr:microtubule associated protein-domain-containing protein [Radiomyces spectabilis]KAI8369635.1 microtubule associated protein-domain-containing protein [Radiomyces spectabilis]